MKALRLEALRRELFRPVDAASIVFLRIAFGLIMCWECSRYWRAGVIEFFARSEFLLPYYGFEWVGPWPGNGMYVHFVVIAVLALFISFGFLYRLSAFLFFLGFAQVFLLDQSMFLNHVYLLVLLSGILAIVPAHRSFSVDATLRPGLRSQTVPAWTLWLLRFQIGIPYFFGGVSKLNYDWLHGWPMRKWLAAQVDFPVIGEFFRQEWVSYAFSYGGLFFDLLIVPALLWRPTRLPAYAAALSFHLFNAHFFNIGVFPWFMIAATLLFFPPDFPRRFLVFARLVRKASPPPEVAPPATARQRWILAALGLYVTFQLLFPLRQFLYPGPAFWTGEGKYFGWHMRGADSVSTLDIFTLDRVTGAPRPIDYRPLLTNRQSNTMSARPWMVQAFSRRWADRVEKATGVRMPVYARMLSSLNGRLPQDKIDPTVNLAEVPATLAPAPWILPLTQPLP